MITVRRDAVRTQGRAPKGGGDQRDREQWVRHRGLKLVFDHAEVVKCDISATANTLKSQDTPNLLGALGLWTACRLARKKSASPTRRKGAIITGE